jgi:bacteriocin-like protein
MGQLSTIQAGRIRSEPGETALQYKSHDLAIRDRELTDQELENVSGGGGGTDAVVHVVKEVVKAVGDILSTGTIGGVGNPKNGVSAGAPG